MPKFLVAALAALLLLLASGLERPAAAQGDAAWIAATSKRVNAKIDRIGAEAGRINAAGGDVSPYRNGMQQVDGLLKGGKVPEAEAILDQLLARLKIDPASFGSPTPPPAAAAAAAPPPLPAGPAGTCDPGKPMVVRESLVVDQDCVVGGDLVVAGDAVLRFDYTGAKGTRLVVVGNVVVQDRGALVVEGRPDRSAIFAVDNAFSQQRSITSRGDGKIRLVNTELRTQRTPDPAKGSVYMSYRAFDRSSFEAAGARLVSEQAWLLAELTDQARTTVTDSQYVPTEIYVRGSSAVKIAGAATKTGLWLDAGGARGTLQLPDMNRPFTWQVGGGSGLSVPWSLQVENAQPGVGIEVRPGSALTIVGNGARAPATGELHISYFVVNAKEVLDGLKAGLQNVQLGGRLTLKDVQLGPIAWQIYAGDNADLTIRNSTINEIGIIGPNAKVSVEKSVLQLAVLAVMAPKSSLSVTDSEIWNQTIEVAAGGTVSLTRSDVHGSLFHLRDASSSVGVTGGRFLPNPPSCAQSSMVDVATGRPRCNPFRTPGMPRVEGPAKPVCTGTEGCSWTR